MRDNINNQEKSCTHKIKHFNDNVVFKNQL